MKRPREKTPLQDKLELLFKDSNAFRAWVLEFRNDQSVGRRGCPDACPITNWLSQKLQTRVRVMGAYIVLPSQDPRVYSLPQWARNFIYLTDGEGPAMSPVDADEALLNLPLKQENS